MCWTTGNKRKKRESSGRPHHGKHASVRAASHSSNIYLRPTQSLVRPHPALQGNSGQGCSFTRKHSQRYLGSQKTGTKAEEKTATSDKILLQGCGKGERMTGLSLEIFLKIRNCLLQSQYSSPAAWPRSFRSQTKAQLYLFSHLITIMTQRLKNNS